MSATVPYRARLITGLLVLDSLGTVSALFGASWLLADLAQWAEGQQSFFTMALALVPAQVLAFSIAGAYSSLRRNDLMAWIRSALGGFAILVGIFALAVFLLKMGDHFSRAAIATWIIVSALGIIATRVQANYLVRRRFLSGHSGERTLLIGEPAACAAMAQHLLSHPTIGYLPVASMHLGAEGLPEENFEATLDRLSATQVVVCARLDCHAMLASILDRLERTSIEIHFAPDFTELPAFCLRAGELAGRPVFHLATSPFGPLAVTIKWLEDTVGAVLLLVLATPVMLLAAIAVKLTSPGPILFRQPRHGLGGRVIHVIKFRTMYAAEPAASPLVPKHGQVKQGTTAHDISRRLLLAAHTPTPPPTPILRNRGDSTPDDFVQASHNDPRVTRVGRFLRATSIDELPQIFNVLAGQMSLVGPRPHALRHNHQYAITVRELMRRHYVKPGITGLAQISGARGETRVVEDMRRRVELNLEYIRTWSVWLDLRILLVTPFVGFLNRQP